MYDAIFSHRSALKKVIIDGEEIAKWLFISVNISFQKETISKGACRKLSKVSPRKKLSIKPFQLGTDKQKIRCYANLSTLFIFSAKSFIISGDMINNIDNEMYISLRKI